VVLFPLLIVACCWYSCGCLGYWVGECSTVSPCGFWGG